MHSTLLVSIIQLFEVITPGEFNFSMCKYVVLYDLHIYVHTIKFSKAFNSTLTIKLANSMTALTTVTIDKSHWIVPVVRSTHPIRTTSLIHTGLGLVWAWCWAGTTAPSGLPDFVGRRACYRASTPL